jgi:hypothetical protein
MSCRKKALITGAPGWAVYFFDSSEHCVYCCLLLPSLGSNAQFDTVAGRGTQMTETTLEQAFHLDGNYPIAWRRWRKPHVTDAGLTAGGNASSTLEESGN